MHCSIGVVEKSPDGIVTLTVTSNDEITAIEMVEAVEVIDCVAERSSPLLVDATVPHSISFAAMLEMNKAQHVAAVAIYAPTGPARTGADFVEQFQASLAKAPYAFKVFADLQEARLWLQSHAVRAER